MYICIYFNTNKKYKKNITFVNTSSNIFIETNVIQDKVQNLAELQLLHSTIKDIILYP